MKRMLLSCALLLTVLCAAEATSAQASYQGGSLGGFGVRTWQNVPVGAIRAANMNFGRGNQRTEVTIGNEFPKPTIFRSHAQGINEALFRLGQQGYRTVDITLYLGGGWVVIGNRQVARQPRERTRPQRHRSPTVEERIRANGWDQRPTGRADRSSSNSGEQAQARQSPSRRVKAARDYLRMTTRGACQSAALGNEIWIENLASRPIKVFVKVKTKYAKLMQGSQTSSSVRDYILDPGEEKYIDCTRGKLDLWDENSADITGASFVD